MLSFTASTREVLRWFQRTHRVEAFGLGGAVWTFTRLPAPGGLVNQDAWLMQALDHCRHVSNDLLMKRRANKTDLDALHDLHDEQRKATNERTH